MIKWTFKDIDTAAEAIWQQENMRIRGKPRLCEWNDVDPEDQEKYRGLANAALSSLAPIQWHHEFRWTNGGPLWQSAVSNKIPQSDAYKEVRNIRPMLTIFGERIDEPATGV